MNRLPWVGVVLGTSLLVVTIAGPAPAIIQGPASVIDGDTIDIQGQHIRFFGVDAPEGKQLCTVNGTSWRCGQQASLALTDRIRGRAVQCNEQTRDRYSRPVAVCYLGNEDLGAWMVRNGWALAYRHYSTRYVPEEIAAQSAHAGIWRGTFTPPWDWRQQEGANRGVPDAEQQKRVNGRTAPTDVWQRGFDAPTGPPPMARTGSSTAEASPSGNCRIKGNINQRGDRIYHLPGDHGYEETRIDTVHGERWFCSEADAVAAGWRKAQR